MMNPGKAGSDARTPYLKPTAEKLGRGEEDIWDSSVPSLNIPVNREARQMQLGKEKGPAPLS
jgi:hypothetical protein